jgi:hypothetical protein
VNVKYGIDISDASLSSFVVSQAYRRTKKILTLDLKFERITSAMDMSIAGFSLNPNDIPEFYAIRTDHHVYSVTIRVTIYF